MTRRILFLLLTIACCTDAFSQHFRSRSQPYAIYQDAVRPQTDKAGGEIWVNYFKADKQAFGAGNFGQGLVRVFSGNDNSAPDSTGAVVSYIITAFDTLVDSSLTYPFTYDALSNVYLDSIRIHFGHENNSGNADTLIVDVLRLDTANHPSLLVLWSDTLVFTAGQSPSNQWQNTAFLAFGPSLLLPEDTAIGIQIRYYGAIQDTFGVVTGFGTDHTACGGFPDRPEYSHFYPNSYAYWRFYNLLLPTLAGGDIYLDCNNNLEYDSLTDGANYIQNWDISALLSSPEIGYPVYPDAPTITVFPNPATDHVYIQAENTMPEDTQALLRSLDGRLLYTAPLNGNRLNLFTFAEGIYLLELHNHNWHVTKKLFIVR